MQKHRYLALAFVSVAASWFGCGTAATPTGGGPPAGTGQTDAPQNGGSPTATATAPGGGTAPTSNPPGTVAGPVDGGVANGGDGGGGPSVTPATDGGPASEAGAIGPIPPPSTVPYIWGVGLGITDVPAAVKFYMGAMQMTVETSNVQRGDRTETTLFASQAKRGARLVLMNFNDKRNTEKITAKLVWQSPNPTGVSTAAAMYPGYVSRLAAGAIVQFDGPETYIQEVGSSFDTGGTGITVPYLVALGMSVSDQPASRKFYTTAFGMTESPTGTFSLTDATGAASITEYTEELSTNMGGALVLQAWTPMRNSKNNPVKIVIFVPDAQAQADKVVAAGGTIVTPAARTPVYDNRKLIVAADPDGYILEIVE